MDLKTLHGFVRYTTCISCGEEIAIAVWKEVEENVLKGKCDVCGYPQTMFCYPENLWKKSDDKKIEPEEEVLEIEHFDEKKLDAAERRKAKARNRLKKLEHTEFDVIPKKEPVKLEPRKTTLERAEEELEKATSQHDKEKAQAKIKTERRKEIKNNQFNIWGKVK